MMEQAPFTLRGRNPDVLTCIANLSNDEVFTPPEFANRMLDTLASAWATSHGGANLWADKTVRFLDPCAKSGVFLREITKRLVEGLKDQIPDLQERVNHILTKQASPRCHGPRIGPGSQRRSFCLTGFLAPSYLAPAGKQPTAGRRRGMSLINISEERLLELGVRFRLDYLSEQAGYTLGLAGRDSQELSAYLPAGLMDEAHALWETVRAKAADKKFAAEEARAATREQNRLFRNAKLWRRRVANLAASASHLGTEMPAGLLVYASARTVPALLSQMENMLKLLDENKTRLPQAAGDLIAEGRSLADGLRSQDAFQEQKRLSELPRATRDINIVKGKLYSAIKAINDIGRTVFAGEPRKAAEYNLSILHRDTGPRKKPAAENK